MKLNKVSGLMDSLDIKSNTAGVQMDRRRTREMLRQERIFNTKVRTIGIDKEALHYQVRERINKEESESKALREYADDLVRNDRTACLLTQKQKEDERLQAKAITHFRNQFQQPSSRREFDLNDPDLLKKQDGVHILPGLTGEDLSSRERARRQREQMRDWVLQQQQELEQAKDLQKLDDQQYAQSRVELDSKAMGLQRMEEELKKITNTAIKDFNQALAADKHERREKERLEEEEKNRTEILNHLEGELLNEKTQWNTGGPGLARPRRDCYKGMTPEQLRNYTDFQLQQAEQKRHIRMKQKDEQLQQDRVRMASARALLLQERQEARIIKELRRDVDQTNMHLAQTQHTQRKKEVYTNIPDESFFSQFNTSSR